MSAGVAGASLVIGISWSCSNNPPVDQTRNGAQFIPNAWLKIDTEGHVIVTVAESEMGQGPFTALPMIVAEELNVDWRHVKVERATLNPAYGYQLTGGSTSISKGWATLRQAGAVARQILLNAAALTWQVPISECRAEQSSILHLPSKKSLSYAALVPQATQLPIPDTALLKEPNEFTIIGTPTPRLDTPDKISGRARFGIDTKLPGMQYATITHCPVFGGKPKRIDKEKTLKIEGVLDVFKIEEGVIVLAKDTWTAFKGKAALNIEWDFGDKQSISSDSIIETLNELGADQTTEVVKQGNPEKLLNTGSLESEYTLPFQAHVPLEPMNCTASFEGGKLRIWAPTQSPSEAFDVARSVTQSKIQRTANKIKTKLFGSEDNSIEINTTLLGGGFGRRLKQDFVSEATQVAKRTKKPVQLVWTREEDIQHDFYHPLTLHEMRGALDENGLPIAWHHIIKGPNAKPHGADRLPYDIPNIRVDLIDIGKILPVGPWRSVMHAYNAFAVEHFFDELARAGNHDPLELRLQLMSQTPRLKKTLEIAADKTDWSSERGLFGVASHAGFGSYASEVVQLVEHGNRLKIEKITCAIDCGIAINPDIAKAQIEGSIVFGLTAALKSFITIRDGQVQQSNYHNYPILNMAETPPIEVVIVESDGSPGGIGEPGVPPLAPALANALFAASGKPTRNLPIPFDNGGIKIT
ncbi:MAG: molybdopterin-dependent oxidoreductase [Candidatus Thiodiazotropha sp. (ex Monitilora ramsayi)]|nr:molybdopterin-dependent oxidoreductase [Candidatus Thiodiazotropha sp. (ex Monitilora ramsayi)]